MNQNLTISVEKYTNKKLPPLFVVSFSESTPNGNGGFAYPLSTEEVIILIGKLRKAIEVPKQKPQMATLENVSPIKKQP